MEKKRDDGREKERKRVKENSRENDRKREKTIKHKDIYIERGETEKQRNRQTYKRNLNYIAGAFNQGTLTEGEGSVQWTSLLR